MKTPIRVLIVDDHAIVREGLRVLLDDEADIHVVGEAGTGCEALEMVASVAPDVIVLDLVMPEMDGLETLRQLRRLSLPAQVLVLTTFVDDQLVRDALQAGATGYLLKDALQQDLIKAIRDTANGQPALHPEVQRRIIRQVTNPTTTAIASLTPREREVLRMIGQGLSNKDIAVRMAVGHGTVKTHVAAILGKIRVADRTQAALFAVRHGLAPLEEVESPESRP